MGIFGPDPRKEGGLTRNRSDAQKRANAERQKALDAAKTRAKAEEKALRTKLADIERKAGKGNLSRSDRNFLKDNGVWTKAMERAETKGVKRW